MDQSFTVQPCPWACSQASRAGRVSQLGWFSPDAMAPAFLLWLSEPSGLAARDFPEGGAAAPQTTQPCQGPFEQRQRGKPGRTRQKRAPQAQKDECHPLQANRIPFFVRSSPVAHSVKTMKTAPRGPPLLVPQSSSVSDDVELGKSGEDSGGFFFFFFLLPPLLLPLFLSKYFEDLLVPRSQR